MKTSQKMISLWALLVSFMFLFASAPSVRADSDADDKPNYGLRGNRITSQCAFDNAGNLIIPQVPPPPTLTSPAPCQGKVTTLDKSPNSRWSVDINWFDPGTQKLYLADRNNAGVDIFDTKSETAVGLAGGSVGIQPTYTPPSPFPNPNPLGFSTVAVANNSGPNGVLVVNDPKRKIHQLWVGDGVRCQNVLNGTTVINVTCTGRSNILVFDLDANGLPKSTLPFATVSSGGFRRADEMAYDPDDQLVLVANDDDLDLFVNFISVSNVAGNIKVVGKISLPEAADCGIEQPVYDHASNKFYLAVPCTSSHPKGAIYVIDPKTKTVVNVFDTIGTGSGNGVPCFPHGLALGPRQNLLLGCSGDGDPGTQLITIIMKATTGAILQTFTQLGGSDEVWYNPGDNKYYLAMSSWTSTGKISNPTGTPPAPSNPTPSLGIIDAGSRDSGSEAPEFIQNILTTRSSHVVAAGFGFACDRDDRDRDDRWGRDRKGDRDDRHHGDCDRDRDDIVRKHAYVPLTTVPIPLSSTATINERGGIGIFGRLP
jgi:hypothetical protein